MTTTDVISPDLKTVLRRLKLSRMLDTLPERLTLARQQKMPHQDLLLQVLSDEVARRESLAVTLRVQKARLDPTMRLDTWDATAKVTFDRALLNELATLRFLDAHAHVTIVGPVGVGKTFLAHALGHIACRRGASVLAIRTDQMLKTLKHARLDNSYEAELRKLVAVDLLILDDFAIDMIDPVESRDLYDLLLERYRTGSIVVTSNRGAQASARQGGQGALPMIRLGGSRQSPPMPLSTAAERPQALRRPVRRRKCRQKSRR
jgi:DNA replication protein DnaC